MIFRRQRGLWQALLLLVSVGVTLKYLYSYYVENERKLKAANIRHHELLEERNRMSRELDGVVESKNSLEYKLRSKTNEYAKSKQEWLEERRVLENGVNKHKANFDALDSEHRMLKSKHDDLQIDHEHMKKSFDRLRDDHSKLDTEHRRNYGELKQKNEKVILALQKQVEHYQKQEISLQTKVEELENSVAQYQTVVAKLQQELSESKGAKKESEKISEVKSETKIGQPLANLRVGLDSLHSKIKKRRAKELNSNKLDAKKRHEKISDPASNRYKALKQKQFLKKLAEDTAGTDKKEKVKLSNIDEPKAGNFAVNVVQKDGKKAIKESDETIEVISQNGKDETNLRMDEQPTVDTKEKESLTEEKNKQSSQEKQEERLNNDQKFDDQDVALQEGDENEDNVADDENEEENGILNQPDKLLLKKNKESQNREEIEK